MALLNQPRLSLGRIGRPSLLRASFISGSSLRNGSRNEPAPSRNMLSSPYHPPNTAIRGPETASAQSSLSEGEKSTEEELADVANLRAVFEEADSDG